jgi:hypothetical protein
MSHLIISKKNEVYLQVEADPHVYYELRDAFQFEVPNAKFSPSYKNKWWDGIIYLFNVNTREIYVGLLDKLIQFCKDHDYTYEFRDNKFYGLPFEINENISLEGVKDYVKSISKYEPRDYQVQGIYQALRFNRKVIVSPTASGKSLMIYSLVRYYASKENNILIIVPTTSLVSQLYKDFVDYGWDAENYCHMIYSGREKDPLWIYVTAENGIRYKFEGNQSINLINNKKKLAKDLLETDEIDDRWLSSIKT